MQPSDKFWNLLIVVSIVLAAMLHPFVVDVSAYDAALVGVMIGVSAVLIVLSDVVGESND